MVQSSSSSHFTCDTSCQCEEEEIEEITEAELLRHLDAQEPPLQVCRRLWQPGAAACQTTSGCLSQQALQQLYDRGWTHCNHWASPETTRMLRSFKVQLQSLDELSQASNVRLATELQQADAVERLARGDMIAWVHCEPWSTDPEVSGLILAFKELHRDLAAVLKLSTERQPELQLAVYPATGAQYVRHRDALPTDDPESSERKVTAILYANDWQPEHGGQLRIWPPGVTAAVDLEPADGRLVVFMSGAVEHAVLPSQAERMALTAWFT